MFSARRLSLTAASVGLAIVATLTGGTPAPAAAATSSVKAGGTGSLELRTYACPYKVARVRTTATTSVVVTVEHDGDQATVTGVAVAHEGQQLISSKSSVWTLQGKTFTLVAIGEGFFNKKSKGSYDIVADSVPLDQLVISGGVTRASGIQRTCAFGAGTYKYSDWY